MAYVWVKGADYGGGYQTNVACDPLTANRVYAGGDIYGYYSSVDGGSSFQSGMLGITIKTGMSTNGVYSRAGAWSKKFPGTYYVGSGGLHAGIGTGFFGKVVGQYTLTKMTTSYGFGTNQAGSPAAIRPRAAGNLIAVDYDGSTEYIYALMSNSSGGSVIARSTDQGATWTVLYSTTINEGAWKSLCLLTSGGGTFPDILLAATYRDTTTDSTTQTGTTVFKIAAGSASIRAATGNAQITQTTVGGAPAVVEKIVTDGTSVYAACGPYGVYTVTSNGTTWTKNSGSFFSSSWVSAVASDGTQLVATCTGTGTKASPNANVVARSTNAGVTWAWKTSATVTHAASGGVTHSVPWGTTSEWWLMATGAPSFNNYLGGSTFDAQDVDIDPSGNIYVCGSAGMWLSKDSGATWRPSIVGINGGEVSRVIPTGGAGAVVADNDDYKQSMSSDHFASAIRVNTSPAGAANTSLADQTDAQGHVYHLVTTSGSPDITKDGVSIATNFFKGALLAVADFKVSDDEYVYIAQFGGGVLVGSPLSSLDTTPPTAPTSVVATANSSSQITIVWSGASDNSGSIQNYILYRGGVEIARPVTSPYVDMGLTASTLYSYTMIAVDPSGNQSALSSAGTATTSAQTDVTAPTVPAGVTATAAGGNSINLAWTASTDAVGVDHYVVTQTSPGTPKTVGSPITNALLVTGLQPSTAYTFTVKAVDAAGNISAASSSASATTAAITLVTGTATGTATPLVASVSPGTVNTIQVVVTDSNGSSAAQQISVRAVTNIVDSLGPVVTWSQGGVDAAIDGANGLTATLSGIVSDVSGVKSLAVTKGGSPIYSAQAFPGGNFSFPVTLATGANVIAATFTDNSPAQNTTVVTFTLTLSLAGTDVTGPTIGLVAPTGDTQIAGTDGQSYNVQANVVDPSGIQSATINALTVTPDGSGNISQIITLALGANPITVVATDNSSNHNVSQSTATITLLSTLGPGLSLSSPPDSAETIAGDDGTAYPIIGQAVSPSGISQLNINGAPVPVDSAGNFSTFILLRTGENTVTITATDAQIVPQTTILVFTLTLIDGVTAGTDIELSLDQIRMGVRIHERGLE